MIQRTILKQQLYSYLSSAINSLNTLNEALYNEQLNETEIGYFSPLLESLKILLEAQISLISNTTSLEECEKLMLDIAKLIERGIL